MGFTVPNSKKSIILIAYPIISRRSPWLPMWGNTVAENLKDASGFSHDQTIIRPLKRPIKETGHIQILRGNLAPDGAVAKITGKEGLSFNGPAKVFDSEEQMLAALEKGQIRKGDVIVKKKILARRNAWTAPPYKKTHLYSNFFIWIESVRW